MRDEVVVEGAGLVRCTVRLVGLVVGCRRVGLCGGGRRVVLSLHALGVGLIDQLVPVRPLGGEGGGGRGVGRQQVEGACHSWSRRGGKKRRVSRK